MTRRRIGDWIIGLGVGVTAGCAAGFLIGIWHGFIAPISLLGSLVMDINIYEVHNTGFPYNTGFLLGLGLWPWALKRLRETRRSGSPAAPRSLTDS